MTTIYIATFSLFLHLSFNTIQPWKYPQNFTWISTIRSPYMQPPNLLKFSLISTYIKENFSHKQSPYMQPLISTEMQPWNSITWLQFNHPIPLIFSQELTPFPLEFYPHAATTNAISTNCCHLSILLPKFNNKKKQNNSWPVPQSSQMCSYLR